MAKKNKQNLQKLIEKKQQLGQINQGAVITFTDSPAPELVNQPKAVAQVVEKIQPALKPDRALRQTAVSIAIISLLLVAAVIFDHRSPILGQFGHWLYGALRLQG